MHYAIIAAGEGSRLVSEGVSTPKPLVPLQGQPMIERLIDIFMQNSPESLTVIVNNEMTQVREFLEQLSLPVPMHLVVKSTPSSMHSFYEVSRVMGRKGKFILTTVDTIFRPEDFRGYVTDFETAQAVDGMMAVTPYIDDEKPLYVGTNADGMITGFLDSPSQENKPQLVSGGIYGLTPPAIDVLEQCLESGTQRMRNYQRALIAAGLKLKAYTIDKIMDIDHQSDILKARSFLNNDIIPQS